MTWVRNSGGSLLVPVAPVIGANAYSWYPRLDKSIVPFSVTEPAAPNGPFTNVTAANATELATHLYTPGNVITLTGDIAATTFDADDIEDVTIIVPPGIFWDSPVLAPSHAVNRLYIRGSIAGSYSGGHIHQLRIFAGTGGTGVVVDGLDITGISSQFCFIFGDNTLDAGCLINCKIHAGGFAIVSTCGNVLFAGNSILTGSDLAFDPVNHDEAYGIRCYYQTNNNILLFENDIRSNPGRTEWSHARFRCHPDTGIGNVWINSNTFVERVENWIAWVDGASGGPDGAPAITTYFENNLVVSDSTGIAGSASVPKLTGSDQIDAYIRNNTFQSNDFVDDTSIFMAGTNSTTKSGNTYSALGSDPAWRSTTPGDPSTLDFTP